jgi:hypothetical protein
MWKQLWFIPPNTWDEKPILFFFFWGRTGKKSNQEHTTYRIGGTNGTTGPESLKETPFDDSISTVEL